VNRARNDRFDPGIIGELENVAGTRGAPSSAACLRLSAALAPAQRVLMRTLRPMVQPNSTTACRNAPTRACHSGSSAAAEKRQILQLASDFPRLWTASTTAARDRKRMLRLLIRDITVAKGPEPKLLRLHIRWQGGTTETVELHLAPNRAEAVRYHDTFVTQIRALAAM
jgi:hypothetical protein